MKKILGLDLGTNSIGWALIEKAEGDNEEGGRILGIGSRIISLGEDKTNFEQGKGLTRNADRRTARGLRRLNKRYKQRRNKLLYVLYQLGMLPEQFSFDVEEKFIGDDRIFPRQDKLQHLSIKHIDPAVKQLSAIGLYELRKNALYHKINNIKDIGRLFYLFNQLRGYAGGEVEEDDNKKNDSEAETEEKIKKEVEIVIISSIRPKPKTEGKNEAPLYRVELNDTVTGEIYNGECGKELEPGTTFDVELIKKFDEDKDPFINIEGAAFNKNKPKKGGSAKTINAKIISCSVAQFYYKKKLQFILQLADGRAGTLTLRKIEQAKDYTKGKEKELLVTSIFDKEITYEFEPIVKSNWRKEMEGLEEDITNEEKRLNENGNGGKKKLHLGEYFFNKLKNDKWFKIRSRVILRKRYIAEFDAIWKTQLEVNEEFRNRINDEKLLEKVLDYVFPGNSSTQQNYKEEAKSNGGFYYLIRNQIIYYQRKLQPQFKLIRICEFENTERGKEYDLKVVPQSHPFNCERNIWQGINTLSINTITQIGEKKFYDDQTLSIEQKVLLYEELLLKKELSHTQIRTKLGLEDKVQWLNGLHVKAKLKGHTTLLTIKEKLSEELFCQLGLNNTENLIAFWRILYNWAKKDYDDVQIDMNDYENHPVKYHEYDLENDNEYDINSARCKRIKEFVNNAGFDLTDEQIISLAKIRFKRAYGSLSVKAINNVLPFIRTGEKYFSSDEVSKINTQQKLIEDNLDDLLNAFENGIPGVPFDRAFLERYQNGKIQKQMKEGGMMFSDAVSLVYGKHTAQEYPRDYIKSPAEIIPYWKRQIENPDDQKNYLRNPIVEQITDETLELVKSIWKKYKTKPDEIRIELARELKNNAEQREKMYKGIVDGEKINNYVRKRLIELKNNPKNNTIEIEGQEPSPANIEKYKLWRKQIRKTDEPDGKEPDRKDIELYRLWADQHHISPYTLKPIPLSKLFSRAYDVDHILPRSRFFDDSLANKVVCETVVNEEKSNRTPYEYLTAGSIHPEYSVKDWDTFQTHVNNIFFGQKRKYLLTKEIPKDFIPRQLKETQYVSIKAKEELGKIVGTKNIKTTTGSITDYLRQHWGLNDKFKEITQDRYKLMERKAGEEGWIEKKWDKEKERNVFKIKLWSKRHDHRHHAIDALVVACTEQKHVQQLNNMNKLYQDWFGEFDLFISENQIEELVNVGKTEEALLTELSKIDEKKRRVISRQILDSVLEKQKTKNKKRGDWEKWFNAFYKLDKNVMEKIHKTMPGFRRIEVPWKDFYRNNNLEKFIEGIIVSHKPNKKLLIQKQKDKRSGKQNDFLHIRGELHESTLYGTIDDRPTYRIKLTSLGTKQKTESAVLGILDKIVSKTIKIELKKHLSEDYKGDHTKAFSAEGIDEFNRIRKEQGKHPIYTIKIFAFGENKMADEVLQRLQRDKYNDSLYVKTGSNYCLGITEKNLDDGLKERKFSVLTFFEATKLIKDEMKKGKKNVDEIIKKYFEEECGATKGNKLLFTLAINDMVYIPNKYEGVPIDATDENFDSFWKNVDKKRIYKVVRMDAKSKYCFFAPHTLAEELEYNKPGIDKESTTKTELEDTTKENENLKKGKFNEYDKYGGCSPFVLDDAYVKSSLEKREKSATKKELEKKIDDILIKFSDNKSLVHYSEVANELTSKLVQLILDNHENRLLDYLKKKDKNLAIQISQATKGFKKKAASEKILTYTPICIQDTCIKLTVDRLGNTKPAL